MIEGPKYSYQDVQIVPTYITEIRHRSECIIPERLPIFTAPMSSVVGLNSADIWSKNGITPIIPRSVPINERKGEWIAVSLNEFKTMLSNGIGKDQCVLIDVANGHMKELYDLVEESKEKYPTVKLMAGSVANPKTYIEADKVGLDYLRVGIGGGDACITSSNTGIHYPMASLIDEMYEIKKIRNGKTKIVADGGVKGYSDVIKALALGADYVMIGSVFSRLYEAEGPIAYETGKNIPKEEISKLSYKEGEFYLSGNKIKLTRCFYGMSSRRAQKEIGSRPHTSEGIVKKVEINGTVSSWVENFCDYLRSAMSYTGSKTLDEFKKSKIIASGPRLIINK